MKDFQRVTLQPGEQREISFMLTAKELGCWSEAGTWVVQPGQFQAVLSPDVISGTMVDSF